MAQDIQTYVIGLNRGGWNPNPNEDTLNPADMADVINLNLHRNGRETRGGTSKVNDVAITDTPRITGLIQFRTQAGNEFIVTGTSNGKIYANYTTEIATGLTANKEISFVAFRDKLYSFNGSDIPKVWNGTGMMTDLESSKIPTDWTTSNGYPTNAVVHGRGASERLWAYGVSLLPNNIYASKVNEDDFSDAEVHLFYIETGDGLGIQALLEFSGELFAFGKRRPYRILDQSIDTRDWGYIAADWESGVAHDRLITKTQNDLVCMDDDGEIFSVIRAQETGDYQAVSLTRPAFIDSWINENIDLTRIDDFFMEYDRRLRAVKIFCIRKGEARPDTVLVYFVDRGPRDGWSKHQYFENYFLSCATDVRVSAGKYRLYTGGWLGHVWELESDTILDDGEYFDNRYTEPSLTFGDVRGKKRYAQSFLAIRLEGDDDIRTVFYIDGEPIGGESFFLTDNNGKRIVVMREGETELRNLVIYQGRGPEVFSIPEPGPLGRFGRIANISRPIGQQGIRIKSEIINFGVGKRAFFAQKMYDYEGKGPSPPGETG